MSTRTIPSRRGLHPVSPSFAYGLVFSISLSLAAWGHDALVRGSSHGNWPALSFASAAPLLIGMCGAAGHILRRSTDPRAWVWLWLVLGAIAGALGAIVPFVGPTVATWLAEPALTGIAVSPIPREQGGTTLLYALLMAGVGTVAGLMGHAAVGRIRVAQMSTGRVDLRSWAGLLICVPIAVLPGLAGDRLVNQPRRASLLVASEDLEDRIRETFTLHTVSLSPSGNDAIVDVVLQDGFVMRCAVSGSIVTSCTTVSSRYREWMNAIADAAVQGQGSSGTVSEAYGLSVMPNALDSLATIRDPSGGFSIMRENQYGDWVIMSAEFNSSTVLTCYFSGYAPVVLNRCRAG